MFLFRSKKCLVWLWLLKSWTIQADKNQIPNPCFGIPQLAISLQKSPWTREYILNDINLRPHVFLESKQRKLSSLSPSVSCSACWIDSRLPVSRAVYPAWDRCGDGWNGTLHSAHCTTLHTVHIVTLQCRQPHCFVHQSTGREHKQAWIDWARPPC